MAVFKALQYNPLSVSRNIGDCVGRQGLSIDTTLDPLFSWLDNTFIIWKNPTTLGMAWLVEKGKKLLFLGGMFHAEFR